MTQSLLPSKPSELINLALEDLEKCENDPRHYIVNMGCWHDYNIKKDKCEVCLAGAVIAQTAYADYDQDVNPDTINSPKVRVSLRALDFFRGGKVLWGCSVFGINLDTTPIPEDRHIPPYPEEAWWPEEHREEDKTRFKQGLRKLAEEFKELGL